MNGGFTNHSDIYDDDNLIDKMVDSTKSTKIKDLTYAQVIEFSYSPKKLSLNKLSLNK